MLRVFYDRVLSKNLSLVAINDADPETVLHLAKFD